MMHSAVCKEERMLHAICILTIAALLGGETVPESEEPGWSVVTILPGDTLESVAEKFGVTVTRLREWNELDDGNLALGRRLRLFSSVRGEERLKMRYRIKEQTTWRKLSNRYELPLRTLLALNKRKRGGVIKPGRRVTVFIRKSRWNRQFLDGGIQLREGPGLKVKHPEWAWGRPVTVRTIEQVARAVAEKFQGSAIVAGDLSKERGGRFPPHKGHKAGLDADLGLFVIDKQFVIKFRNLKAEELDVERTWFMLSSFLATGRVERVLMDWRHQRRLYRFAVSQNVAEEQLAEYFQYPAKRWENKGIIRHFKGHRNHIHIRFKELDGEAIL